jgi:hypothetical protein
MLRQVCRRDLQAKCLAGIIRYLSRHLNETGEKAMDTRFMVPLVITLIAIALIVMVLLLRKQKSDRLKQRFGPEYDRTVKEQGAQRAETVLAEREQRVKKFAIRPLTRDDRERYVLEWTQVQKHFVDDQALAVGDADKLVTNVMAASGYPMGNFEQRAADLRELPGSCAKLSICPEHCSAPQYRTSQHRRIAAGHGLLQVAV